MDLNIDLKNININDLKEKVLAMADKKTLIKVGASIGAVVLFLIIYYGVLNPIVNEKKVKLADMNLKQEEIAKFNKEIKAHKKKIKKLQPEFKNFSTLFHTRSEVEELYETLSEFADMNGLVISRIEKKKAESVSKNQALNKDSKKKVKKDKKNIAYYKIPVEFEIEGSFLGYIKFKRAISLSKKMLNFDKESIKVVKRGDSTGTIKVSGTLTIVGLEL